MIGLTGNFGTGKSTVAALFREKGAGVVNADRLAHEAFRKKSQAYSKIRSLFPELRGRVTRRTVARIVFREAERRRALEAVIHPYVLRRMREEARRIKRPVILLEVPLLFETGLDRRCDRTVVVTAPFEGVARRLRGKGFTREETLARWRAQMPLRKKVSRADLVIDNSGSLAETRFQVKRAWKTLRKLS